MYTINDNFLPTEVFDKLKELVYQKDFKTFYAAEKQFCVLQTPEFVLPFLQLENHKLLFTFIRKSDKHIDNTVNIHTDNYINGEVCDTSRVLYLNDPKNVTMNGTAFWRHKEIGERLSKNTSLKNFENLVIPESNNQENFIGMKLITNVPNRLLTYDANLYHSKFPAKLEQGTRIVLVAFYQKIK